MAASRTVPEHVGNAWQHDVKFHICEAGLHTLLESSAAPNRALGHQLREVLQDQLAVLVQAGPLCKFRAELCSGSQI